MTIPISQDVNIIPGVVPTGGAGATLNGLVLTQSTRPPIGQVPAFPSALAVGAYFGLTSTEYNYALVYFGGFTNSQILPSTLYFAQYPEAAVAGYVRSASLAAMTLAQLQAVAAGTLTVTTDGGSPKTTASINLSAATSFSNAAAIISAALTTATSAATCAWDAVLSAFVITSGSTGGSSSVVVTTSAFATALSLTAATGAVTSAGAAAAVPGAFMTTLLATNNSWAGFTTNWVPSTSEAVAFAAWTSAQNYSVFYVPWDESTTPTQSGDVTSIGYQIKTAGYSGSVPLWQPSELYGAPFVLGYAASINWNATNGRATAKFRTQAGLLAGVSDPTVAGYLEASGYNYIAAMSGSYTYLREGTISGSYLWLDSFLGQIILNSQLQASIINGLTTVRSLPYNAQGKSIQRSWCDGPIAAALNAGIIRAGVTLSASQASNVDNAAGVTISTTLQARGWYLQIQDASPTVRTARGSFPCTLWYMDGQSVQKVALNSLNVQ